MFGGGIKMQNESHDLNEFKIENVQNDAQNLTLCSNCNKNVPKVLFCLNCGSPLSNSDVNSVIEKPGTTLNIGNNENEVLEEPQFPEDVKIDPVSVEPNKKKLDEAPIIVNKKPNKPLHSQYRKSLEILRLPIIAAIPCSCDIPNSERKFFLAAEKPNHPFTRTVEKIATKIMQYPLECEPLLNATLI